MEVILLIAGNGQSMVNMLSQLMIQNDSDVDYTSCGFSEHPAEPSFFDSDSHSCSLISLDQLHVSSGVMWGEKLTDHSDVFVGDCYTIDRQASRIDAEMRRTSDQGTVEIFRQAQVGRNRLQMEMMSEVILIGGAGQALHCVLLTDARQSADQHYIAFSTVLVPGNAYEVISKGLRSLETSD